MKKKDEELEAEKEEELKETIVSAGMKFLAMATFIMKVYEKSCEDLEDAEKNRETDTDVYYMTLGAKLAFEKIAGLIDALCDDFEDEEEESEAKPDDVAKA